MRNTLKTSAVILLVLLIFTLAACGGSAPDELAGTWKLAGASYLGQEITADQLAENGVNVDITMEFTSASSVKVNVEIDGETEEGSAKYTFEDNVVTIDDYMSGLTGSESLIATLENGQLHINSSGVILILEHV